MRSWYPKAAQVYVDMQRGVYRWPGGKQPKHGDGSPRVVLKQVLIDVGIAPTYGDNKWHEDPDFLACVTKEEALRDCAITDVVAGIEKTSGPLLVLNEGLMKNVADVFARPPDADDPQALSPKDYVTQALPWSRYLNELTGHTRSREQEGIQSVLSTLAQGQQITGAIVEHAMDLVAQFRKEQDLLLARAGIIDGTLDE